MSREDGTFVFFVIQHRKRTKRGKRKNEWTGSNLDHFGHPPGFTSSAKCWQRTGINGCFDEDLASKAGEWLQDKRYWEKGFEYASGQRTLPDPPDEYDFRLVKRLLLRQQLEVVDLQ